jgi:metallo-beta-lactamase family protein
LRRCLPDTRHTILFLAFLEEGSVGRLLQDGADHVVISGETVERRAAVENLTALAGLADGEEMRAWLRLLGGPIKRAFVVHGDDLSVSVMMTILREEGVHDVIVPREGESFPF